MTTPFWLGPAVRLASTGTAARLSILMFHRVQQVRDPLFPREPDAERFEECMRAIRDFFVPLPLMEACQALERGRIPHRAVAITFDDGYADNFTVALPILKRLGIHGTFFIATDFVDGGRMWNDTIIETVRLCPAPVLDLRYAGLGHHSLADRSARRAAIRHLIDKLKYMDPNERLRHAQGVAAAAGVAPPDDLMMTSRQIRELAAAGMALGGHTCGHPILARIPDAEARREVAEGRDRLEAIAHAPIRLFAYPNGKPGLDYSRVHVDMVRDLGFSAAVSTARGVAGPGCDRWQLPRFTPWDLRAERFALHLAVSRHTLHYATT